MSFYPIVVLISAIIWLFPPIRHYRTRFFYFFLILGLSDVLSIVLLFAFMKVVLPYYLLVSFLVLIALFDLEAIKQKSFLVMVILAAVVVITFFSESPAIERLLFFVLHGFILLRVIHMLGLDLLKTQALNGFYVVLIFYELLTLTKFFNLLVKVADLSVLTNFFIVTSVQIAIGIFFIIFKEDDRRIRVKLE
ncbi:MAG: hypothetical protein IT279_10500 [Ignavibacteriaceae bacterium]|nr:hypothetical protein [Ignavibacteriaceae bacterium]